MNNFFMNADKLIFLSDIRTCRLLVSEIRSRPTLRSSLSLSVRQRSNSPYLDERLGILLCPQDTATWPDPGVSEFNPFRNLAKVMMLLDCTQEVIRSISDGAPTILRVIFLSPSSQ